MTKRLESMIPAIGIVLWLGLVMTLNRHDAAFYCVTAMFAALVSTCIILKLQTAKDADHR